MKTTLKPNKVGAIRIQNHNYDPFNNNQMIDNTMGDDVERLPSSPINDFKKKHIERITQGVEKTVRIKSGKGRTATANTITQSKMNNDEVMLSYGGASELDALNIEDKYPSLPSPLKTVYKPKELLEEFATINENIALMGRSDEYRGEEDDYICYR